MTAPGTGGPAEDAQMRRTIADALRGHMGDAAGLIERDVPFYADDADDLAATVVAALSPAAGSVPEETQMRRGTPDAAPREDECPGCFEPDAAHELIGGEWVCPDVAPLLAERAEDCPHDSSSGDEGPVADLPGGWPVRWRCDGCGEIRYHDDALTHLRSQLAAAESSAAAPVEPEDGGEALRREVERLCDEATAFAHNPNEPRACVAVSDLRAALDGSK